MSGSSKKESSKGAPTIAQLLAPASTGDNVYRLHLKAANGKFLTVEVESKSHVILAKGEQAVPESIFELHQSANGKYAIRSSFGKFLNVDESIELLVKEKQGKESGLKADKEGGDVSGSLLTDRERLFEIVPLPGGRIALRAGSEEYYIGVEPGENKTKVVRNAGVSAALAAAATVAAAAPPAAAGAVPPVTLPADPATPYFPSAAEVFTPLWLDDRSPLTLAGRFTFLTAHRKFLCAEPNGNIIANRDRVALWEPLQVLPQSLTHVALKGAHGGFLGVASGGSTKLIFSNPPPAAVVPVAAAIPSDGSSAAAAASPTPVAPAAPVVAARPLPSELFEVVELEGGKGNSSSRFAFRAANGLFVCAQGNHTVTATSKSVGPWETFQLTPDTKVVG